ncbi:hypothetical protein XBKB1_510001 [Xenorhabdus bovienii str. kraussei Becker Underwood]|uniref:Uncharacterized protein n=1 Tax=Xenorhabdus bovienii str. kraussei Becker Underwood TaxID=1398204 RepID=A0A077PZP4_XENBV|nr:hypothetical protein XBKB1_510001 [Xenorhabdus bovienii str. kraussei Becker Underwood]
MGKSQHLLAEQSPNSGFGDNPLIFNQTPDLAFAYTLLISKSGGAKY